MDILRFDKSLSSGDISIRLKSIDKVLLEKEIGQIGQNLDCFKLSENGIPELIEMLSNYFDLFPENLKLLGIFRVSGSLSEEEKLEQALKDNNFEYIFEIDDGKVIASHI